MSKRPGLVRDAIVDYVRDAGHAVTPAEVHAALPATLGTVPASSVRSSLQKNEGSLFERRSRGRYILKEETAEYVANESSPAAIEPLMTTHGKQRLYLSDCIEWLKRAKPNSVHAVVTDPPYGLREYEDAQQKKMRAGRGGVWRLPPAFDGANRKPLPRFTVLTPADRTAIGSFFAEWGSALLPVLRPGGHIFIAGNPLLTPLVANALQKAGFERRGEIVRLVRTFRGGDRPKGAHEEYPEVSTMPRSCWEPWGLYRKPISEATVAANLKKWGTGALRRPSEASPFVDVIESGILPASERLLAPHPSAKPQAFMRQLVHAALPTGSGVILDPFAGCATTLAACEALGVEGVGVEIDPVYWAMAVEAVPKLAGFNCDRVGSQPRWQVAPDTSS